MDSPSNLDLILNAETQNESVLRKLSNIKSNIQSTAQIVETAYHQLKVPIGDAEFKPDMATRVISIAIIFVINLILTLLVITTKGADRILPASFLAIGSIWLIFCIRQYFFSPSLNYRIKINYNGIDINDTNYPWETIEETAIFHKARHRSYRTFLIIQLKNNPDYLKLDLRNFDVTGFTAFEIRLAYFIEFYKIRS